MIFETTEEINPNTGAKRVLVYEDDGSLIMFTEKYYEGDEEEIMMAFDSNDECNDGPQEHSSDDSQDD